MEEHFLQLSAANAGSTIDFLKVSEEEFENVKIFEFAAHHANNSSSFKRARKKLELLEITPKYLIVRITSDTPLEMVSKSLSGFSRELLRIDASRAEQNQPKLFSNAVYNHSLFKSTLLDKESILSETPRELSNTAALKMCVDLFYGDSTKTKMQHEVRLKAIAEIKKILSDYKKDIGAIL